MKYVIKRDGSYQEFKRDKIIRTCLRSGVPPTQAQHIAEKIEKSFSQSIPARLLYEHVLREIENRSPASRSRYQLKEAVARIDPELFELYVMRVLEGAGYACVWNRIIAGATIEHQVDIVGTADAMTWFIECKHHVRAMRDTGLGEMLQLWARLLDIQDGYKKRKNPYQKSSAWMITNTKFSQHARKFAEAKKIRLSDWSTGKLSFQNLIEQKRCYPVTILNLPPKIQERCEHADILSLCDILRSEEKVREIFGKGYSDLINRVHELMS